MIKISFSDGKVISFDKGSAESSAEYFAEWAANMGWSSVGTRHNDGSVVIYGGNETAVVVGLPDYMIEEVEENPCKYCEETLRPITFECRSCGANG